VAGHSLALHRLLLRGSPTYLLLAAAAAAAAAQLALWVRQWFFLTESAAVFDLC